MWSKSGADFGDSWVHVLCTVLRPQRVLSLQPCFPLEALFPDHLLHLEAPTAPGLCPPSFQTGPETSSFFLDIAPGACSLTMSLAVSEPDIVASGTVYADWPRWA